MGLELERSLTERGVIVVLRNSTRNTLRYRAIEKAWPIDPKAEDKDTRSYFGYIAAFSERVDGLESLPLKSVANAKQIEVAYQRFLDETDEDFILACIDALASLREPIADAIEKPDAELTDEERADPN